VGGLGRASKLGEIRGCMEVLKHWREDKPTTTRMESRPRCGGR